MKQKMTTLLVAGAFMALGSQAAFANPDWSKVPKKDIHVIHPGAAPLEWVRSGDHSGASALKKGETCAGCHVDDKGKLDIDLKRLAGKELEPKGAPKTMSYQVGVQADASDRYPAYPCRQRDNRHRSHLFSVHWHRCGHHSVPTQWVRHPGESHECPSSALCSSPGLQKPLANRVP